MLVVCHYEGCPYSLLSLFPFFFPFSSFPSLYLFYTSHSMEKMPTSTLRSNRTIMDDNESNETSSSKKAQVLRTFWLIGLLNNAPWVLMLACAPNIASGGVALVFLSNQIPGLLVKITAPYWFHKVSYNIRMLMAAVSMCTACLLVGYGGLVDHGIVLELLGVSFISFQCSLGEVTCGHVFIWFDLFLCSN